MKTAFLTLALASVALAAPAAYRMADTSDIYARPSETLYAKKSAPSSYPLDDGSYDLEDPTYAHDYAQDYDQDYAAQDDYSTAPTAADNAYLAKLGASRKYDVTAQQDDGVNDQYYQDAEYDVGNDSQDDSQVKSYSKSRVASYPLYDLAANDYAAGDLNGDGYDDNSNNNNDYQDNNGYDSSNQDDQTVSVDGVDTPVDYNVDAADAALSAAEDASDRPYTRSRAKYSVVDENNNNNEF